MFEQGEGVDARKTANTGGSRGIGMTFSNEPETTPKDRTNSGHMATAFHTFHATSTCWLTK